MEERAILRTMKKLKWGRRSKNQPQRGVVTIAQRFNAGKERDRVQAPHAHYDRLRPRSFKVAINTLNAEGFNP